ncbi:hypothetical protein [Pseudoxanthomonas winnipegensis]|uniref:hypothetical protein n=1 Tax=Pseudoxanthomonas winnipegensis TaxID=2480810 RepID=UPI00102DC409|nr:hypothetical protein [Pseudoxanthomonas winnipegensis]RZZ85650.1 hypothetical protein EA663_11605 [Pseudoxanthomonas winnipegensis]
MATVQERYNIAAGRPYTTRDGQEKKQWVNIGRAVKWDDGGISLEFTSIPVGNWWDGKASLFVQDDNRQENSAQQRQRPSRHQQPAEDDFNDRVPF